MKLSKTCWEPMHARQVRTIQRRFCIERIALVGDRGMIASARIREERVRKREQ